MTSFPALKLKAALAMVRLVAVFFLYSALHPATFACQCSTAPTSCQSLGPDAAIFLGEVTPIESGSFLGFLRVARFFSGPPLREQYWEYSDRVTLVFNVEETFSGAPQKTARLQIGKYIGACGYEYHPGELFFKKGERYLVYAASKAGVLATNHCSKPRLARGTDPEIVNLRRLSRLSLPIIAGNYFTPARMGPSAPLSRQTVTLTSLNSQSVTTKTDADGRFTFSSLAPATYHVKLTTPRNYAVDWRDHQRAGAWFTGKGRVAADAPEVTVSPSSCAEVAYTALPDGRISGYITDPQGSVPKSASLRIWPANQVDTIENSLWTQYPDLPGGEFELGPLHPGTYVIGTYIWPPDFEERSKDMNLWTTSSHKSGSTRVRPINPKPSPSPLASHDMFRTFTSSSPPNPSQILPQRSNPTASHKSVPRTRIRYPLSNGHLQVAAIEFAATIPQCRDLPRGSHS